MSNNDAKRIYRLCVELTDPSCQEAAIAKISSLSERQSLLDLAFVFGLERTFCPAAAMADRPSSPQTAPLRRLLDAKANVNQRGPCGWTPLMFMAEARNASAVAFLISVGADRTVESVAAGNYPAGITAVDLALASGGPEISALIDRG